MDFAVLVVIPISSNFTKGEMWWFKVTDHKLSNIHDFYFESDEFGSNLNIDDVALEDFR